MKIYLRAILLSLLIMGIISILPALINKILYKDLINIFFVIFFITPLFCVNKNDNDKVIKIKYSIIVFPFFIIYTTVILLVDNITAIPLSISILLGGYLSYLLLKKHFFSKIMMITVFMFLAHNLYPMFTSEFFYQTSRVDENLPENIIAFKELDTIKLSNIINDKLLIT